MYRTLVILIAVCNWAFPCLGATAPVALTRVLEQDISAYFWLAAEPNSPWDLPAISHAFEQDSTLGIPLSKRTALADSTVYWMVGEFLNQTDQAVWFLRLSFQGITHGRVWVQRADGQLSTEVDFGTFQRRSGNDGFLNIGPKYNQVPLSLPLGERCRIYIRMENTKRYIGPVASASLLPFTPQVKTSLDTMPYLQGFMSGVLILLVIFSAALYWITRERSYYDYVWYLLATIIWAAFNHGMLRDWLLATGMFTEPKYVFLVRSLILFIPYLYLRFVWTLGNLEEIFPKFTPWINRLWYVVLALFLLDWTWLLHSNFNFILSNVLMSILGLTVLIIVAGFLPRLYKLRQDPLLRLILYAILVLMVGLLSTLLRLVMNGFQNIEGYELAIAQVADLGIFATALGRKFRDYLRQSAENEVIRQLLNEKDILLKEVHHRVKNNLQVVSSLLRLQALHAKDQESKAALRESHQRLQSMSMIHEKLYQQDQLSRVNVQDYFGRLATSLFQTYRVDQQKITLQTDIDPVELDLETVMPIGLLLNELLSNALEHAFSPGEAGEIKVAIKQRGKGLFISVADNGQGMHADQVLREGSFGHQLVEAFATKLGGRLAYQSKEGTTVSLHIDHLANLLDE